MALAAVDVVYYGAGRDGVFFARADLISRNCEVRKPRPEIQVRRRVQDMKTLDTLRTFVAALAALAAAGVVVLLMVVVPAEPAGASFPGENGKIAFARFDERSATSKIFTMNPDGTKVRRVSVRLADADAPTWSPDGKRIAFSGARTNPFGGPRAGNIDIYVVNADGSGLRRITRSRAWDITPAWSPDGGRIAFARGKLPVPEDNGDIYTIRIDGTGLQQLTDNKALEQDPDWSPDGKTIAFDRFTNADDEIYAVAADGGNLRNLTRTPGTRENSPSWSPDGRKIAFNRGPDVLVMNAGGGRKKNLTRGAKSGFSPVYSPDGKNISFVSSRRGNLEISVMKSDGTRVKRLTRNPSPDFGPDWQPLPAARAAGTCRVPDSAPLPRVGIRSLLCGLEKTIISAVERRNETTLPGIRDGLGA